MQHVVLNASGTLCWTSVTVLHDVAFLQVSSIVGWCASSYQFQQLQHSHAKRIPSLMSLVLP